VKRFLLVFLAVVWILPQPHYASSLVIEATIEGPIHGVTAEYVTRAIEKADSSGAELLIFRMDTPGGLVSSTEEILQAILGSRTPIAVLVAPGGARAASAGFYITLSSDIAAMAPGTRIGAAHPVTPFGDNDKEDVMMEKVENDLAAQARSIAQNRGRNIEVSEKIVRDSISLTELEAVDQNLIDLISADIPDLLKQLDGMTIKRFDGSEVVLDLGSPVVERFEMTRRQKILAVISDPTVSFILLIIGVLGLYIEFTHPGLFVPGILGGISLLLFAISSQILPLNLFGLLLIAAGIVLFVLEVKFTSFGLLTAGGIASITLGFLTLFEGPIPEMRLPSLTIVPFSVTISLIMAFLTYRAFKSQSMKVTTGKEGLEGEVGTAVTDIAGSGRIFVHGEYWNASSSQNIPAGTKVRIRSVGSMSVEVERDESS
jgi:membrane-bound serine protease (ClpP class)